jgi:hypothetical protein
VVLTESAESGVAACCTGATAWVPQACTSSVVETLLSLLESADGLGVPS